MGPYNRAIHKQILIRNDTKSMMDDFKEKYNLRSYNDVIRYMMEKCQVALVQR